MSTAIRRTGTNVSECPRAEKACFTETNQFKVEVLKNEAGGGFAKPVYVHIYAFEAGRELLIERIFTDNCDPITSPYFCGGQAMALTQDHPDTVLVMPGEYRFRTADNEMLDDIDFAVEVQPVHAEYAELWFRQQQLCCCWKESEKL